MRKIILTIIAVILGITYGYAESCSSGQGSLSYQISGCGEESRACCSGTWCAWGTSSCASCTATSQACSGNVTNACAGNRTRSVTGSCGSTCTYSGWNDSGCSYTQSCTATSESRNCSGNVTNACAGTQTRTRTVAGTCGSCSYNSWGSWSTNGCSYTQSCTATSESRNCSGNVTNACAGTQTRTRTVAGTCGSCSYNSWGSWSTNGCSYTQSCTATSESRNCSGNVTNACAGTQTRTRTVAGTCGSCSYNSWGSWSTNGCSYTQSCTATSESRNCSGNVTNACAGTQTRTRTVAGTCGSCSYNSWGSWSTSGCSYTQSCTATSESRNCSGNVTNACAGTQTRTRTVAGSCGSCSYNSWSDWSGSCTYTQSCTATTQACSGNVSNACAGNRTRTVTGTCGSCSYSGWNDSGCSYTQNCAATTSRNCVGNVADATGGTQTGTLTNSCGSCSYSSWGGGNCTCGNYKFYDGNTGGRSTCLDKYDSYVNTKDMGVGYTDISKCYTARDNWRNSATSSWPNCDVILDVDRSAFVGQSGHNALCAQYDNGSSSRKICLLAYCHYGFSQNGYNYNIYSYELHTCNYTTNYANYLGRNCTATSESRACSGNVDNACSGNQTRTRTLQSSNSYGQCTYSDWSAWNSSGCQYYSSGCAATVPCQNFNNSSYQYYYTPNGSGGYNFNSYGFSSGGQICSTSNATLIEATMQHCGSGSTPMQYCHYDVSACNRYWQYSNSGGGSGYYNYRSCDSVAGSYGGKYSYCCSSEEVYTDSSGRGCGEAPLTTYRMDMCVSRFISDYQRNASRYRAWGIPITFGWVSLRTIYCDNQQYVSGNKTRVATLSDCPTPNCNGDVQCLAQYSASTQLCVVGAENAERCTVYQYM